MINFNSINSSQPSDHSCISPVSSAGRRVCSFIASQLTAGNVTKAALALTTYIGASMATTAQSRQESVDGMAFTSAALSLTCLLSLLKNGPSSAKSNLAKLCLAALSLNAVAGRTLSQSENPVCTGSFLSPGIVSLTKDARVEKQLLLNNLAGYELLARVDAALKDGGQIVRTNLELVGGSGGAYFIKDKHGDTLAIFKPEDERLNGPENPNPLFRKKTPSEDDIYFHKMDSFEQGEHAVRQYLANVLHVGQLAKPPLGLLADLTTDLFVDVEAESRGLTPKVQTKRGFLQEWKENVKPLIQHHPRMIAMTQEGFVDKQVAQELNKEIANHPMLDAISIDEYQEICINDLLIYNEDRHAGNLLVSFDTNNTPHLIPIDQDSILPSKFRNLFGLFSHAKSREPFTQKSLDLIASIDPDLIEAIVEKMSLFPQAQINAKMMAIVLKKFAASGATVHDIVKFASNGDRSDYTRFSDLWKLVEQCKTASVERLSADDKAAWVHSEYLRRADWCLTMNEPWCEPIPVSQRAEAALWQKYYAKERALRINAQVRTNFWLEFNSLVEIQ